MKRRRALVLLSLLAALAGTPLRLAEAAEDLARSLAELGRGVNLEEIDGGVGDDSGAVIKVEVVHHPTPDLSTPPVAGPFAAPVAIFRPIPSADRPMGAARRFAWLGRLLC